MFITEKWNYKVQTYLNFNNDDFELLWIEVEKDSTNLSKNLVVGTVYRRPCPNPEEFTKKLDETITIILAEN